MREWFSPPGRKPKPDELLSEGGGTIKCIVNQGKPWIWTQK